MTRALAEMIQEADAADPNEVCPCQCIFCRVLPEHTLRGPHPRRHGYRCQVTHQEQLAYDAYLFGLLKVNNRREANAVLTKLQKG